MKLVLSEKESDGLRSFLGGFRVWATSRLATVEVPRAIARTREVPRSNLQDLFERVNLIELDAEVAAAAARLSPRILRSLDAVHLASALRLEQDLAALVTYDRRLAMAAREAGLRVEEPL